uniref:CSON004143 protein n=1 Tax=Culicoides sonorensis TaxID=179676 RepID=A0A336LMK9_CULSO
MSKGWKRPSNVPFPSVWMTFKAKDLETDNLVEYRVQDLPEEYYDEALKLMEMDFLKDEAMCNTTEFLKDPISVRERMEVWRNMLKQKLVLACFRENSKEIVGLNMLKVQFKDDKLDYGATITGKPWSTVSSALMYVAKRIDPFEKYNVDKYLTSLGLSVNKKYRRRGIATEILKARVPLCKAMNIPLTTTVFTGESSQKCAIKAGFQFDAEVEYAELCRLGLDLGRVKPKSLKLMSLVIE